MKLTYQPPRLFIFFYVNGVVQLVNLLLSAEVLGLLQLTKGVLGNELAGSKVASWC